MNTKERLLRSVIRKEIKEAVGNDSFLSKVGAQIRGPLGARRTALDQAMQLIDIDRIKRLSPNIKVDLLAALAVQFGIGPKDFRTIQGRVLRKLKQGQDAEPVTEAEIGISKALSTQKDKLGDTQAMQRLMKMLATKPSSQQVDFIIQLIKDMPLEDATISKLKMKIRQDL
jgi:hypothetical protein